MQEALLRDSAIVANTVPSPFTRFQSVTVSEKPALSKNGTPDMLPRLEFITVVNVARSSALANETLSHLYRGLNP
jgi:hypothetical protein